ncbi:MAG: DNA mismatch repair protein MutS [Proteobacteria bacterium]|nr:DNA mismatch repair protein MutS [Pseudomonadota bacterium]
MIKLKQIYGEMEMARRGKDKDDEDEALWQLVTQDVKPLDGRVPPAPKATPPEAKRHKLPQHTAVVPDRALPDNPSLSRDLDRRTLQKLERGQMAIEAVLDLHGHSQAQAIDALNAFIPAAHKRGMRCVLVITGKGSRGGGVLRNNLTDWLDSPALAPFVLKATPAKGRHGGGGAFYVYLRRARG